jgi:hypothetical protein
MSDEIVVGQAYEVYIDTPDVKIEFRSYVVMIDTKKNEIIFGDIAMIVDPKFVRARRL